MRNRYGAVRSKRIVQCVPAQRFFPLPTYNPNSTLEVGNGNGDSLHAPRQRALLAIRAALAPIMVIWNIGRLMGSNHIM